MRVAINGFGRIGRNFLRAAKKQGLDLDIVAVNDLTDTATLALLLKYDSVHGRFDGTVETDGDDLVVDGTRIKVLSERDPAACRGSDLGVDVVIESTGFFTKRDKAAKHLEAGAKKVIISAPAKGEDVTIVLGANEDEYDPAPTTSSRWRPAPPTRSCRWPRCSTSVRHRAGPDDHDPRLHRRPAHPRRAAQGPAPRPCRRRVDRPDHHGRRQGRLRWRCRSSRASSTAWRCACRSPTARSPTSRSILDREVTVDEVNAAMKEAAEGPLKGILEYSEEPIVSIDIVGNPHSCIFDAPVDDGRRHTRQGARLVRQRVGLLDPAGRLHQVRRRPAVSVLSSRGPHPRRTSTRPGSACSSAPTSTSPSATARSPTTCGAVVGADPAPPARPGRARRRRLAPRPPEGGARPGVLDGAGRGALEELLGTRSSSPPTWSATTPGPRPRRSRRSGAAAREPALGSG
jgi:glyceraldehyde 3-phosphate dehydrogenase